MEIQEAKSMLRDSSELQGLAIRATDGELGTAEEFYFDDEAWAVRYLVVKTGGWLSGKKVLISPYSILKTDWDARQIDVKLTMKQVQDSPGIDTALPVSRQHEVAYLNYYNYPNYWNGPYLWGSGCYPGLALAPRTSGQDGLDEYHTPADQIHLRSTQEVTGYHLEAVDGEIGHLHGFILDEETWAIRYLVVATTNWWPGKYVLISPAWVTEISWEESKLDVDLTRQAIKDAPEYIESRRIFRSYEDTLFSHYHQPPYWLDEADQKPSFL